MGKLEDGSTEIESTESDFSQEQDAKEITSPSGAAAIFFSGAEKVPEPLIMLAADTQRFSESEEDEGARRLSPERYKEYDADSTLSEFSPIEDSRHLECK